jgi:ABC-type transport system substrate-binding protein
MRKKNKGETRMKIKGGNRMKYKVGDRVRIRSREWIDAQDKDSDGDIDMGGTFFVEDMFKYAGKIAKIVAIRGGDNYRIDIENNHIWPDWTFDPDYNSSDDTLSAQEAIKAMLDGETLYDEEGRDYYWRAWVPPGAWVPPQNLGYTEDIKFYQRARLLPDLSGVDESTIQRFEVEE